MKRALLEFKIDGFKTTIPFQHRIPDNGDFKSGRYNIRWVEQFFQSKPMG